MAEISKQLILRNIKIEVAFEHAQKSIRELKYPISWNWFLLGPRPSAGHLITISHFPHVFTLNYIQQAEFFYSHQIELRVNFLFIFKQINDNVLLTINMPYINKRLYYAELDVLVYLLKNMNYIINESDFLNTDELLSYNYFRRSIYLEEFYFILLIILGGGLFLLLLRVIL